MAEYQGHRSWNAWNISLWLNNTESDYFHARELTIKYGRKRAARILTRQYGDTQTPDGAKYNYACIYEALEGIDE